MLIGIDFLGYNDGSIFQTEIQHQDYYSVDLKSGLIDHLYVDEDLTTTTITTKPTTFTYNTVISSSFKGTLEGGSLENAGLAIEKIRFQKRRTDELYWSDVAELVYTYPAKTYYEALDKYVQNDFEYEYSLLPVTNNTLGTRVTSNIIRADFDGYFISDKTSNFRLLYDAELGSIDHVNPSSILEPLNSKYPIISYGSANYRQSSIKATILTPSSLNGIIDVRMEKLEREKIMNFLKNRKPKIFRGMNSEIMLITIVDNPKEENSNNVVGLATVSFSFVEIGDMSSTSLRNNGLIEGLSAT